MINDILARSTNGQPIPVVGMPATILYVNDRYPATISDVYSRPSATIVEVRQDNYRFNPDSKFAGQIGHQDWIIEPNPEGERRYFRLNAGAPAWREVTKNEKGRFVLAGSGVNLRIGEASVYRCWEF